MKSSDKAFWIKRGDVHHWNHEAADERKLCDLPFCIFLTVPLIVSRSTLLSASIAITIEVEQLAMCRVLISQFAVKIVSASLS